MVVLINMVKPPQLQIGGGRLGEVVVMTWSNLFIFVLVLLVFSYVSIEVPLTLTLFSSTCSFRIRLRFGNRPLSAAVSFMTSLTFPRPVFWYVYSFILLVSFDPTARLVKHALRWLETVIPINQVYDISISTTAAIQVLNEHCLQQDQPSSETPDLEVNIEAQQV